MRRALAQKRARAILSRRICESFWRTVQYFNTFCFCVWVCVCACDSTWEYVSLARCVRCRPFCPVLRELCGLYVLVFEILIKLNASISVCVNGWMDGWLVGECWRATLADGLAHMPAHFCFVYTHTYIHVAPRRA